MADEIGTDPKYKNLGSAIRQALAAQSCLADLKQSSDCCKALRLLVASPRKRGTIERSATENSLLANAVMLYARATATTANKGARGETQIATKLNFEQRTDHDIIVKIRNRALAHVHTAEPIANSIWHQSIMFATEIKGGGWRPAGSSRRIQFDEPTLERLERQLPVAHTLVKTISEKRIAILTDVLNSNPVPSATFEAHRFDPVERFGSTVAVREILGGLGSGEASALT